MAVHEVSVTAKIGNPPTGFLHNQSRCRIIPFSEKSFRPRIKTPHSNITNRGSGRAIHTNAAHYSVKFIYQVESCLFVLLGIIWQLSKDKCIFYIPNT